MSPNWKIKAFAQRVLWRVPGGLQVNTLLSQSASGHNTGQELLKKHAPYFARHLQILRQLGMADPTKLSALEIGTGWDLDVALLMRFCGFGRVMTADAFRHVRLGHAVQSLALIEQPAHELQEIVGCGIVDVEGLIRQLAKCRTIENLCSTAGIDYVAPVSPDYAEFEDSSIDVCYSTAVLEHIRPEEIRHILRAVRRKLKPKALSTHVIDLKDHFAYFDHSLPYNNFLRYSDSEWDRIAGNPLAYNNRLSASQWKNLFVECGYDVVYFCASEERNLSRLPAHLIHPENRVWSEEDLRIGELHVIARPHP